MKHLLSALAVAALAAALQGSAPAAPAAGEVIVHISGFAFKPPKIDIHTGGTVLFVNDDDEAHTVTASDKSFDSGGLDTHESWRHTFEKAGTYTYFCELHPYMKAVIVVSDTPAN